MINSGGWDSFVEFWSAAAQPRVDPEFLGVIGRAAITTAAYAVLGTALALMIGLGLAPFMTRFAALSAPGTASSAPGRRWAVVARGASSGASVLMRGFHEIVWALALVQIFGLDPLVAILAIGLPYGAVTARVFADHLDAADPAPFRSLRLAGAGRGVSILAGVVPQVRADLVSYAFYRLECAMRSAAILGIVGLGGLGFELALSFQSLRFDEVWTAIWALVILGGLADRCSSWVRRRSERSSTARGPDPVLRRVGLVLAMSVLPAWLWVDPNLSLLWSSRTRSLAADLAERAWPPSLGDDSWWDLGRSAVDTVLIATGAIALAAIGAFLVAFLAAGRGLGAIVLRFLLLVARAVPPPVWAFVVVLVLLPGILPGAVALGFYNLGVLGRLQAEVVENHDRAPARSLSRAGAPSPVAFIAATVPAVWSRFRFLGLYRWEVAVRDSVTVGVAGATGLGRDLNQQLAARDFDRAFATLLALLAVTVLADRVSAVLKRRTDRRSSSSRAGPAASSGADASRLELQYT